MGGGWREGSGMAICFGWSQAFFFPAVDRHYHTPACFDAKSENSKGELRATATGHFLRMNMRSHHLVGTSNGVMLRRIVYVNPEDGVSYTYLTNDNTLPACHMVLLYKHRWDIEKIFHQFKSKMVGRKSWASSLVAKQSHAIFECLAHNLLLLFEKCIGRSEGLRDEMEFEKHQGRSKAPTGIIWAIGT